MKNIIGVLDKTSASAVTNCSRVAVFDASYGASNVTTIVFASTFVATILKRLGLGTG
jgi:hypothetical protein